MAAARYALPLVALTLVIATLTLAEDAPPAFTVTVTDPGGKPIPGADVWFTDAVDVRLRATTDESGTATFEASCARRCYVRVEAGGYAPWTSEKLIEVTRATSSLGPGTTVAGSVHDIETGDPIPGATVRIQDRSSSWFDGAGITPSTTDEAGRYHIEHVPAGRVALVAYGTAHAVARHNEVAVPGPPDDPDAPPFAIDPLFLGPGGRLAGAVRGPDGPVAGVGLQITRAGERVGGAGPDWPWPLRTADDGTFAFEGIPAGVRFRIVARKDAEYARAVFGPYEVRAGTEIPGVALTLSRGGTLRFRTVDADGGPVRPERVRLGARGDWVAGERIRETEDGFAVRQIVSGEYRVRIVARGFVPWDGPAVRVRDGEAVDLGEIMLRTGGAVAGRAVDPDGDPIAGVRINARWQDPEGTWFHADDRSAEDGTFLLGGIEGAQTVRIGAHHKAYLPALPLEADVGVDDLEIVVRRGGIVRGSVSMRDGEMPAGVRVTRYAEADPESVEDPMGIRAPSPETSDVDLEEGTFGIKRIPEGRYTLSVRSADSRATRVEDVVVTEGKVVDIGRVVLERGLILRGEVVSADGDVPVPSASLVVERPAARTWMRTASDRPEAVRSGPDGRFVIRGLDPGAVVLAVTHPHYAKGESRVILEDGTEPEPMRVRLSAGGTITGTARNRDGSPAAGNHMAIMIGFAPNDLRVETAEDGTYRFQRLPPGPVRVVRFDPGRESPEFKQATVRDGEVTIVDFGGTAPIVLTGRVRVGETPAPNAQLAFHAAGAMAQDLVSTRSDAEGRFEAGFDRAGAYSAVLMEFEPFQPGTMMTTQIEVPDEPRVERDVVFAASSIAGRVTDAAGAPIRDAQVVARRPEGDRTSPPYAFSGEDGSYRIRGVPPGTYHVVAAAEGLASDTRTDVAVAADDAIEGVDFTLVSGRVVRGLVTDPAGRPVADAIVSFVATDARGAGEGIARTDVHGRFVASVSGSGEVEVRAFTPGWAPGTATGESGATAAEAPEIVVRLTAGGTLTVRVVDTGDEPVAGATLIVQPQLDDPIQIMMMATQGAPIVTGADGRVTIPNLPPATYNVQLPDRPPAESMRVDVRDGEVTTTTLTVQSP